MGNYSLTNNWAGGLAICTVFLYLSACGLFKNVTRKSFTDSHTQARTLELKTSEASSATIENRTLRWATDSGKNAYQLEVWPRGQFSFSTTQGFRGEAEKFRFSGTHQSALKEKVSSDLVQENQSSKQTTAIQKDKSGSLAQVKSVESTVSWKIIFSVLCCLTILTLWLLSKKPFKSILN